MTKIASKIRKVCCFLFCLERQAKHVIVSVVFQQGQMTHFFFFFCRINHSVAIFRLQLIHSISRNMYFQLKNKKQRYK